MRKSSSERGIYMILMAAAAFVIVALCALAIGLGYLSFNRTIHQNIANLSALAGVEEYVRTQGTYQQKTTAALARANYVLSQNTLKGISAPLGDLGHAPQGGDGGTLRFGVWHETDPNYPPPTPAPCAKYPCFVENPPPSAAPPGTQANAVRIETRNQTGSAPNPILIPFGNVLGKAFGTVNSDSIGVVVDRCVAFLLDVSGSVTGDTHSIGALGAPPNPSPPPQYLSDPDTASLFAYRQAQTITNCLNITTIEQLIWCNHPTHSLLSRDPAAPIDPQFHYRSDYQLHPSPVGNVMLDKLYQPNEGYFGAEPLSTLLKAFNRAVALLTEQASVGDQALMLVFTGDLVDRIPASGLTKEFGLLTQLTNYENIGVKNKSGLQVTSQLLPNFVHRGWLPIYGTSSFSTGTNIALAMYEAMNEIATNCSPTSKKVIILASDGLSTCSATAPTYAADCTPTKWARYQQARAELLGPILQELQDRQITFGYLLAGAAPGANFINRVNPNWNGANTDPQYFLTPEQAVSLGYGGALKSDQFKFFDQASYDNTGAQIQIGSAQEEDAFNNAGQDGWIFGDPNGVLGELALATGGVPCPLLPRDDVSKYWDHDGDQGSAPCNAPLCQNCTPCVLLNSERTANARQRFAIEWRPQAEIAAGCTVKAVGEDPFALREPPP